jgi:dTDP-4-dehydrorhamnose 3,5-epimerase
MRFVELPLAGAYVVELEPIYDHRGLNARVWCAREFAEHGLSDRPAQGNIIVNSARGTLRGFHYQAPPMAETKLFRVTRGGIYDVIVDLRPESPTYRRWHSVELWAGDHRMLYVPERFGQAFQTLADDTELTYQVSAFYSPEHGRGFRYDDAAFAVEWPLEVTAISEQDASWPPWEESEDAHR